jgi:predicted anti-sigma-YlaC factor YlaD
VARNFWFEHVVDAFLQACAEGRDWKQAVAEAERAELDAPRRVLTQKDLKAKGVRYSRQHVAKRVARGTFPRPFQLPP